MGCQVSAQLQRVREIAPTTVNGNVTAAVACCEEPNSTDAFILLQQTIDSLDSSKQLRPPLE
jgi:hypothetical protein